MKFQTPLHYGTLEKRYKRFLADLQVADGETLVAHCPNSGSMLTLNIPGMEVGYSRASNPERKLKYTLEAVKEADTWVSVNTQYPNRLVEEAWEQGLIPELLEFTGFQREVVTSPGTRLDGRLTDEVGNACYIEIKSVTLKQNGIGVFPDAVTERGLKHLESLIALKQAGHRAMMVYVAMRDDCFVFDIARAIDPAYDAGFQRARAAGVEILCYAWRVEASGIFLSHAMEIK